LLVGWVFISEGIQKFLFADALGAGRFARIGIPAPEFTAAFVGVVEVLCGAMIVLGVLTRLAAIPLIIDISVAIVSTKIPILLGRNLWRFVAPKPPYGIWPMLHEARVDFSMLLGLIFLLIAGPGRWSFDWSHSRLERLPPPNSSPTLGL
jgi:uncharacterized membrane protein YphA (DoxX/SURF4 family)